MTLSMSQQRTQLERKRQELQKRIEQIQQNEQQETERGESDTAHEWENADVRGDILSSAARELNQVDDALQRIDLGTYGLCDVCDEPIAEKRLNALPFATRCIGCADS